MEGQIQLVCQSNKEKEKLKKGEKGPVSEKYKKTVKGNEKRQEKVGAKENV